MSEIPNHIEPRSHEEQSRHLPMGAEVVRLAELQTHREVMGVPPEVEREKGLGIDASDLENKESRLAALNRVRHILGDIMDHWPEARTRLDQSMNAATDMPQLFKDWHGQGTDWADWLANHTSDDQLLNVLQWHNDRLARYNNDTEIRAEVEARKSRFAMSVENLFAQGHLCPDRYETIMRRLQDIEIRASDLYATDSTTFPEEERAEAAYYKSSRGVNKGPKHSQIYVLPELLTDPSEKTVEHELAHEVERTFWTDPFWMGEVAADIIATIARKDLSDPKEIFRTLLEDKSNLYAEIEEYIAEYLHDPRALKAFLRCTSASTYKDRAREEKVLDDVTGMERSLYQMDQGLRNHMLKTNPE